MSAHRNALENIMNINFYEKCYDKHLVVIKLLLAQHTCSK